MIIVSSQYAHQSTGAHLHFAALQLLLQSFQMGRAEGVYDEAIESLSSLLKQYPQLKPTAAKKIEELTKELSLVAKSLEAVPEAKASAQQEVNPLEKIKSGFLQFKEYFKKEQTLFKALAESQHPKFMIFACSDSRVDPYAILGLQLGDAFIVRNVANLVPSYTDETGHASAGSAVEYAVLHLKVEHIMVIGHSRCGGIKALMGIKDDGSNRFSEFIEDWVTIGKRASKNVKAKCSEGVAFDDQCTICAKEAVNNSLWNCMTYPFVKDAVLHEKLSLHGAYYDFVDGALEMWSLNYKLDAPEKFQ